MTFMMMACIPIGPTMLTFLGGDGGQPGMAYSKLGEDQSKKPTCRADFVYLKCPKWYFGQKNSCSYRPKLWYAYTT